MDITLKANLEGLTQGFSFFEKKQVPWAQSLAVAKIGNMVRDGVVEAMDAVFDRPTTFTKKGVRVAWISKDPDGLQFRIFLNEWAAKGTAPNRYLYPEVEGGRRNETRFERALRFAGKLPAGMAVVPGQGAPLDGFGNVRNGVFTSVLSQLRASTDPLQNQTEVSKKRVGKGIRGQFFIGRPGGGRLPLGIYQRLGMRPLFLFIKRPSYRPRLMFYKIAQAIFDAKFDGVFRESFDIAMRNAR